MSQSTFDDVRKRQMVEKLTGKKLSTVRLLSASSTQSMIARQLGISRSSVCQTVHHLESLNLVKKTITQKYNCIYEISPQLQKMIGGIPEKTTSCHVHNIALRFSILQQDHPVSKDKRSGYVKEWMMRGGPWYAFWYPGKAGEVACTVTVYPRSILIRMDAKQTILAKDVPDATIKGFQHLIHIRQKFIEQQRLFGVHLEIEPTGRRIGKPHGGFALSESNPAVKEGVTEKGWWIDKSKSELGPDKVELESHIERGGPTRLDRLIQASEQFEHLPDIIKATIDPLSQNVIQVKAMLQGGITLSQENDNIMKFLSSVLKEMAEMREEIRELKTKDIS